MNLLSIGGSDPSSGAGIQSDIKTFELLNTYGLTVVTAITSQNTTKFEMVEPVSQKILKNQLKSLISDFEINGIKIGMVYNSESIKTIYDEIKNLKVPIVLDPVIKSTTGGALIKKASLNDFKKFLVPLATVITPNKFEAEFLSKIKIDSKRSLLEAAQIIQNMGVKNVVITGSEIKKDKILDFILDEKTQYTVSGKKIPKINHGSGCNYSSSLLVSLAKGKSLREAVEFSKKFTYNSIKNAKKIGHGVEITQIKKDMIEKDLENAINEFVKIKNIYKNIPECQTNFVFSKKNPKSIKDILGISGRIVKTGKTVTVTGNLSYGGSKHVATALNEINKKFPEIRSAINLKYTKEIISKIKKKNIIISSYDRNKEPKNLKNKEGSSIAWGIKHAIQDLKNPPDVIFHKGDLGKEPMIIIFANTPLEIIEKISKHFI